MHQQQQQRKEELVQQLKSSRQELIRSNSAFRKELSISTQFQRSFKKHPVAWFGSSLGAATLLSLVLRRPSAVTTSHRKGLIRKFLGTGFGIAKPFLTKWFLEYAQERVTQEITRQNQNS